MLSDRSFRPLRRAFMAIEALGTFTLMLVVSGAAVWWYSAYIDDRTAEVTAGQQSIIATGASSYVKDNYTTLVTQLPYGSTTILNVSIATLKTAGYLNSNISSTNPYGQTYELRIRSGTATNLLEALVVSTGGQSLDLRVAAKVARLLKSDGGFTINSGGYCGTTLLAANTLCGVMGVWSAVTSRFVGSGSTDPGQGHLVSALFFTNGSIVDDYLYRKRVPGNSKLNQMQTYLQMGTAAVAVAGQPCYQVNGDSTSGVLGNGAIAVDSTGAIMTCVSGAWTAPGAPKYTYAYFALSTCPTGWVLADGNNGTIDVRGVFLRSADQGRGIDPGRAIGSSQATSNLAHTHTVTDPGHAHSVNDSGHNHTWFGGSLNSDWFQYD
jgi:hypothetical protein